MATSGSLRAIKEILSLAQAIWGVSYVMDASTAVYPFSGNGPSFDSLDETVEALKDYISEKHAKEIRQRLTNKIAPQA